LVYGGYVTLLGGNINIPMKNARILLDRSEDRKLGTYPCHVSRI